MPSASSASATRGMPFTSAALCIGTLCTEPTRGIGMCIPTAGMLTLSPPSPIGCGGIGGTVPLVWDGVGTAVVTPVIGIRGIPVITGAAIGATLLIIMGADIRTVAVGTRTAVGIPVARTAIRLATMCITTAVIIPVV